MKSVNFSFLVFGFLIASLFLSCNQSGQTNTEGTNTEGANTEEATGEVTETTSAANKIAVVISHHVKDFAAWTQVYYDHKPARQAAGLTDYGVFQDFEDPTFVSVTELVTNRQTAEEFLTSEDLKKAMAKAGVTDEPEIKFYEFTYLDSTAGKISENRMFVIHKVEDYNAWKKIFDENEQLRKADGLSTIIVARNLDDPNEVAISGTGTDMRSFKSHMENPAVKEAMQKAGVIGEPKVMLAKAIPSSVI